MKGTQYCFHRIVETNSWYLAEIWKYCRFFKDYYTRSGCNNLGAIHLASTYLFLHVCSRKKNSVVYSILEPFEKMQLIKLCFSFSKWLERKERKQSNQLEREKNDYRTFVMKTILGSDFSSIHQNIAPCCIFFHPKLISDEFDSHSGSKNPNNGFNRESANQKFWMFGSEGPIFGIRKYCWSSIFISKHSF